MEYCMTPFIWTSKTSRRKLSCWESGQWLPFCSVSKQRQGGWAEKATLELQPLTPVRPSASACVTKQTAALLWFIFSTGKPAWTALMLPLWCLLDSWHSCRAFQMTRCSDICHPEAHDSCGRQAGQGFLYFFPFFWRRGACLYVCKGQGPELGQK